MAGVVRRGIILFRERGVLDEVLFMIKKTLIILLSLIGAFSITIAYAYDPYSAEQDKKETEEDEEAKEPVYLPYSGPKKRVAVTKFDNKVKGVYGNQNLGEGF